MRFLHAADLHIDSPLRGLDRYDGAPVDRLRSATRSALERLVDRALADAVDFILLSGDIYDRDWQDFHTGLFFRAQMVRLDRGGIRVFLIQGNHDAQGVISKALVLPANVKVFSSRTPETERLDDFGVAIHGRSFPDRAVIEDWVPSYPEPVPGYFNIGLLHTSLNGNPRHDTYAPTDKYTLIDKGYDYWALGHIHAREVICESPRIVFPGNLQGRHARETGPKGCEWVNVDGGRLTTEFIPLDVVRWHHVELSLQGVDHLSAVGETFRRALLPGCLEAADRLHAVRVTLTGATPLFAVEAQHPGTLDAALRAAAQDFGDMEVWIEQVRPHLANPIERGEVSQREDAVGELVRLVDAITEDEQLLQDLGESALAALLRNLPAEISDDETLQITDMEALRELLRDAEATVLARLVGAGDV